jgi:uncharacterized FlgJ-related protein
MDIAKLIYDTARLDGMPSNLANFIAAQARHETGDFTSAVFRTCKNAFGYKYVGQSGAIACSVSPEGDTYAGYPSVQDSVYELTGWIRRRQEENKFPQDLRSITTATQYAQLLKGAGFYADTVTNYTNGLIKFAVNYGGAMAFGSLVILAISFLYFHYRK